MREGEKGGLAGVWEGRDKRKADCGQEWRGSGSLSVQCTDEAKK